MRRSQIEKRSRRYLIKQFVSDYEIDPPKHIESAVNTKTPAYERIQAAVKFYSRERGYGFCKRANKPDIFFSSKALEKANIHTVKENDILEFDLIPVQGKGGKALNIKKVDK